MSHPDDAQSRLLEAAGQIFAEKGYKGATVREICERAGTNLAAVNYYFRDKERLYIETVKSACRCGAKDVLPPDWPPGTPPAQKLREFISGIVNGMLNNQGPPWHRQLWLREMGQPSAACAELVRDHIRPFAQRLAGIIEELLPHVPERTRALVAFSIVGQSFYHRVARPVVAQLVGEEEFRAYDAELLADHIAHFSLAALGFEPPVGQTEAVTVNGKGRAS